MYFLVYLFIVKFKPLKYTVQSSEVGELEKNFKLNLFSFSMLFFSSKTSMSVLANVIINSTSRLIINVQYQSGASSDVTSLLMGMQFSEHMSDAGCRTVGAHF